MLLPLLFALAPASGQALACETLQAQIEARFRANGVTRFSLVAVEAAASAPGREVGRCDLGKRKILYRPASAGDAAGGAPARPPVRPAEPILTECKDGRVSMGGDCRS